MGLLCIYLSIDIIFVYWSIYLNINVCTWVSNFIIVVSDTIKYLVVTYHFLWPYLWLQIAIKLPNHAIS